jgi:hypothetical protein
MIIQRNDPRWRAVLSIVLAFNRQDKSEGGTMPPRGVKSAKRARQYEHIKESAQKRGRSTKRAKEIAAATVNKQRRQAGETKGRGKSKGGRKK